MANKYNQISSDTNVRFSNALFGEVETSRMTATPVHLTTFNAGELVPVYCREILPDETLNIDLDFVIRQSTLLTPTMGSMVVDFYAFFVPNRIVNDSWKAVQGENFSGSWTANSVSLAPLVRHSSTPRTISIPVNSVADYYGFPTQSSISSTVLEQCHDLKFRGYVMIWNEFFRDQNYQPPIPLSTLNVYQGFLDTGATPLGDGPGSVTITGSTVPDGSFGAGAIAHSLYGSGGGSASTTIAPMADTSKRFRATSGPLPVNKLHDYFTSVLPSPQKSPESIFVPATGSVTLGEIPVVTGSTTHQIGSSSLTGIVTGAVVPSADYVDLKFYSRGAYGSNGSIGTVTVDQIGSSTAPTQAFFSPDNLYTQSGASASLDGVAVSLDDIRFASAIQQVYETLGRGGSRYRSVLSSFFGIEINDLMVDTPLCLGHIRRNLDLYQTAQTSSSVDDGTPQGNLAAFGYTSNGGKLFSHHFLEHGYVHVFACVRHRNIYSSMLSRDNFRLNLLDFYLPPLANISEQPVYTREINPFSTRANQPFGYQEAWAEYRYEPDMVTGLMRPGAQNNVSLWNYADDFNSQLNIATGAWLKSNSKQVLDRTLAVTSAAAPQLKGMFRFVVDKILPMPTYSVPGMDII
ncbi:major capsid protein [Sigmofec virus UA08Rod_5614]|uniref:Major capsid protein n=1 Tax=Sigmofec virus UA08Rod_5614 TaxID=2929431 RepID=A0A976N188_9VIRU|nr:major capsid protein [Sigmofec virus UA08Rod_5614]